MMSQKSYLLSIHRADEKMDIYEDKNEKNFVVVLKLPTGIEQRSQSVKGSSLQWQSFFSLNLDQENKNSFQLELLMDETIVGSQKITYRRIKRQVLGQRQYKVNLERFGKHTATIFISVEEHKNLDLVGGISIPFINLAQGMHFSQTVSEISHYQEQQIPVKQTFTQKSEKSEKEEKPQISQKSQQILYRERCGFEVNRAEKLNCFSCMDANDLETQFFPHKFRTKCSK